MKENDWITAESPVVDLEYNVVDPAEPSLVATVDYIGPPLEICDEPVFTITDSLGDDIVFLASSYEAATNKISITLPDASVAEKGTYELYVSFTLPGDYIFDTGLSLRVYDICDDSTFPEAPAVSPDEQDYWIGQGDLVFDLAWAKDTAYGTSGIFCGDYEIQTEYDSAASTLIGDPYDPAQTTID